MIALAHPRSEMSGGPHARGLTTLLRTARLRFRAWAAAREQMRALDGLSDQLRKDIGLPPRIPSPQLPAHLRFGCW